MSQLPNAIKLLNQGRLDIMSPCMLPYLRAIITKVSSLVNEETCRSLGQHMLEVASQEISDDEKVYDIFVKCTQNTGIDLSKTDDVLRRLYMEVSSKLFHARINEFMTAAAELELLKSGKAVKAEQSLRDQLKTYSSTKAR